MFVAFVVLSLARFNPQFKMDLRPLLRLASLVGPSDDPRPTFGIATIDDRGGFSLEGFGRQADWAG